jgi:hypothetical protein
VSYSAKGTRFEKYAESYHVYEIDENELVLTGGGDFYDRTNPEIDDETWAEARRIAEEFGMVITRGHGEWQGWSEYTPDPGDLSVFEWRKA